MRSVCCPAALSWALQRRVWGPTKLLLSVPHTWNTAVLPAHTTTPHHTTRRAGQSAAGAGRVKSHSQHARAPGLPLPLPLCAGCASHTYHHKLAPAQTCCWTHYSPTMGRPRWEHLLDTAYTSSSTATISTLLPPSSTTCGQGQAAATTTTCQAQARGVSSRTRPVPVHAYCMHLPHRPANKLCVQPYLPACLQHP